MSIPAARIWNVNPGVLSAGGNSLAMNGLFLTQNTAMPTGAVLNFVNATAVSKFFGPSSAEAAAAAIYFAGFQNSTVKPGGMLFAAYNAAARTGFLLGGSLAGVTLSQLQALSGTLTISVAGTPLTSSNISLSGATSFSNAATLIQAGFTTPPFAVSWNPVASAFVFTTTATGATATISFATGTLSEGIKVAATSGGILSQGAVADTPGTAMDRAVSIVQNFATVVTLFEPDLTDKEAFAVWFGAQNDRNLGIIWDSDANASVQGNTTCFGSVALVNGYEGITCISGDPALASAQNTTLAALALNVAIFLSGAIASINFSAVNGRTDAAFLISNSADVVATVADAQISQNLLDNGYNYYGAYATANQGFTFFYDGQMPGRFGWIDSYVNQIFFNSQLQLALATLQTSVNSVPYNPAGYGLMRNALMDPINAALSFGTIRTGVTLSSEEISAVNAAAGGNVAPLIQTQGFYLQIADPGAEIRAQRGSPIVNLWYADGQDIQAINLGSINIQ